VKAVKVLSFFKYPKLDLKDKWMNKNINEKL